MILIATLFWKLQTLKDFVRPLSRKHRFRLSFDSQHVQGCQTLFFITLREPDVQKISLSDVLNLRGHSQQYLLPMASILFWIVRICRLQFKCIYLLKPKTFSYSFVQILESTSNFKHFQEKYESHSYFFSEIRDCERLFQTNL